MRRFAHIHNYPYRYAWHVAIFSIAIFSLFFLYHPIAYAAPVVKCDPWEPTDCGCHQKKDPQTNQCKQDANTYGCPCLDVTNGYPTPGTCITPETTGPNPHCKGSGKKEEGEGKPPQMPPLPQPPPPKDEPKPQPPTSPNSGNCPPGVQVCPIPISDCSRSFGAQNAQGENTSGSQAVVCQKPPICSLLRYRLALGASGNDVRTLQNFLADSGDFKIGATGYFGPITKNALAQFQLRNGIIGDVVDGGMLGPLTWDYIYRTWSANPPSTPMPSSSCYSGCKWHADGESFSSGECSPVGSMQAVVLRTCHNGKIK